jgi:hypothetical protein
MSFTPVQWLAVPKTTNRTEVRTSSSPVVHATTDAGSAHADQANRGQSSDLTFSAPHHSVLMNLRRTSEHRLDLNLHLACPPPQCLAGPT